MTCRYLTEEDLEHRLEVMLSRRAVAMAHAQQHGRVDCVGASKGLFFGLLLLVGSLICLILFFVLIHHPELGTLAIYLADVSHCVLMALSIMAIIVGFIRWVNSRSYVPSWGDRRPIISDTDLRWQGRWSPVNALWMVFLCVLWDGIAIFAEQSNNYYSIHLKEWLNNYFIFPL